MSAASPSPPRHPEASPVVVLVRPQLGQNIGMAIRAMANCGLTHLRLVAPRDGWPSEDARQAAAGADAIYESVAVFDTLAEAVADCERVYATTVRPRGQVKPVLSPTEAASAMHEAPPTRDALVFGPERTGLENDEVAQASQIVTAPLNPDFTSLNLAQAVLLVAWEWWRLNAPIPPDTPPASPAQGARAETSALAARQEVAGFLGRLESALDAAGFFTEPTRRASTLRNIRNIFTRHDLTRGEVDTLHGILSALIFTPKTPRKKKRPGPEHPDLSGGGD
jgi:tRNA/rRNA methyltransferase